MFRGLKAHQKEERERERLDSELRSQAEGQAGYTGAHFQPAECNRKALESSLSDPAELEHAHFLPQGIQGRENSLHSQLRDTQHDQGVQLKVSRCTSH